TSGPHERRLLNDLLSNYNVLERPVANESEILIVYFSLTLQQLIDVDEKNQNLEWIDSNLRWSPNDYGGITDLRISPDKVWRPDVLLYNSYFGSELDLRFSNDSNDGDISPFIPNGEWVLLVSAGLNERHLINHLLADYNPLERPVENENDTLNVILGISLQQIIEVQWTDVNLRWNPEDYGGIETLRISTDRIWIPDVLMYNSADERFDSTFRTNVVVNYTGGCLYVPPGIFKSTCQIDITWFPFDDQRCELKFGSWSHNGLLVDLIQENSSADVSPYLANGEWVLVDVPSIRTSKFYECCPGPFVDIKFIIHIKRRTLYYGFNLIIPCIILSSMTLLSFSLPPESGEKLQLGVTILLSMTVFLVQLSKILPATSDSISIIALYFGSIMIMVAVSVVMTVVVLNFHHRSYETKEMGPKVCELSSLSQDRTCF
ncbi:neuronal acetylcholine receptor subunit alpha-7-like protein, partial [Sarcoptes scabiei]